MSHMSKFLHRHLLVLCIVVGIFAIAEAAAANPFIAAPADQNNEQQVERKKRVVDWFRKYDQIRRNAEMSLADKFQAMLMAAGSPGKRSVALATRMSEKYKIALAEIKRLEPPPETRNLQDGYTEYFSKARQVIEEHLADQERIPLNTKSFMEMRKYLEELDGKNKQLDDDLRKEYKIPKHRHS